MASAAGDGSLTVLSRFEPIRSAGWGGASAGISNDPTLAPSNPCAAAALRRAAVTLGGQRGFFGDSLGTIQASLPVGPGSLSLGALYYAASTARLFAADGSVREFVLQRDVALSAGFGGPLGRTIWAGAAVKLLRSELFGEFAGNAVAADAGFQMRLVSWLKAGLVVRNAGTGIRYGEDRVPLPTEARLGLAAGWTVRAASGGWAGDTLLLMADATVPAVGHHLPRWQGGIEYRYAGMLSARGGVSLGGPETLARIAAGLGLTRGRFRVDYALRFASDFDLPHAFSLTVML